MAGPLIATGGSGVIGIDAELEAVQLPVVTVTESETLPEAPAVKATELAVLLPVIEPPLMVQR